MTTGYYMMVSIWFVLSATAGNKKGDFITCTQDLSVMGAVSIVILFGLRATKHSLDLKFISAFCVVAPAQKI
jgi:hypothetical protein